MPKRPSAARRHNETTMPHAPDVLERRTADGGFSAGWGLHHTPSESYILDCHTHLLTDTAPTVRKALKDYYGRAGALRLGRHVALDGSARNMAAWAKVSASDDRLLWMLRMEPGAPDLRLLKRASKMPGFVGLKLLNISTITRL